MKIKDLFGKPKVILIVGNSDEGKSNLAYYLIQEAKKEFDFKLYSYGLKCDVGDIKINSVPELEQIKNSVVFLDEFESIIDFSDKKKRKLTEKTLRLLFWNNNILVFIGNPNNFNRFLSGKASEIFYCKSTLADFINGSRAKEICLDYRGEKLGMSILNLNKGEVLYYNGQHYEELNIPLLDEFNLKKENKSILVPKKVPEKEKSESQKKFQ